MRATRRLTTFFRTQYGGRGKFFADVLQSVESKLPRIVFIGLREVARVRNKLSHELEFGPDSIPPGFEELCTEIIFRLHKKADSSSSGTEDARVKACCREMLRDGPKRLSFAVLAARFTDYIAQTTSNCSATGKTLTTIEKSQWIETWWSGCGSWRRSMPPNFAIERTGLRPPLIATLGPLFSTSFRRVAP